MLQLERIIGIADIENHWHSQWHPAKNTGKARDAGVSGLAGRGRGGCVGLRCAPGGC
jgi:hypothetical protein